MPRMLRGIMGACLCLGLLTLVSVAGAQPDFGQEWQKTGEPLFATIGTPGSWNDSPTESLHQLGTAVYDGEMYMTYFGGSDGEVMSMGLVSSAALDGDWAFEASNPILTPTDDPDAWDAAVSAGPAVVYTGEQFLMWYTGVDTAGVARIGLATSADGVAWTKSDANPVFEPNPGGWDPLGVQNPAVVKYNDVYHMWYSGTTEAGALAIGYATSSDGVAWTRASEAPVLTPGEPGTWDGIAVHTPTVVVEDGTFLMWYVGLDGPSLFQGAKVQTGFAKSDDGINWEKDPNNPVLPTGADGSFDSGAAAVVQVFKLDADTYAMLYGGTNLTTFFGGLLATLDVSTSVEEDPTGAPESFALHQNFPNPFNPSTTIEYALPVDAEVTLAVYNTLGQPVRTLVDGRQSAGFKTVIWDGRDDRGQRVHSGIYFYTLETSDGQKQTRKMVLIK